MPTCCVPGCASGYRKDASSSDRHFFYAPTDFVAHPNVQQQMSTLWYDGLPGFRRKSIFGQCLQIVKIGVAFPFYSAMYIFLPRSRIGRVMKKPFVKFISNAFSYLLFLRE
ncbi:hypothetical protein HPB52_022356 [Rhipicephalus sanguineus]|uniref:THAP-type domain-containing protein n=1 Tax=Rhipicephalus sanguineus TaxID=34632 RepID=A0A9D4Q8F8_RHISA|nr:hypothetical protein HPB52_022356 [Rhipicephalus sanguineus]